MSKQDKASEVIHLYIHFPFCLYKCHYCDFNSTASSRQKIPLDDYTTALIHELKLREKCYQTSAKYFFESQNCLKTIYFGGGTPSLMRATDVLNILNAINVFFCVDDKTEITLEANPGTLDRKKLKEFKEVGINRLSIGIQSLHDAYLSSFGRIHTALEAHQVLDWVSQAGFNSWNADLIFGFPGQTPNEWQEDLHQIISWNPPHLSCYAFSVEEGSLYSRLMKEGKVDGPDEDVQLEMLQTTEGYLESNGIIQYETSNYSIPHHQSQHNLNYWNYGTYLGLGAGACSQFRCKRSKKNQLFGYRTTNSKSPQEYMASVKKGELPWHDDEQILLQVAMGEFMMMGLRLKRGIDRKLFRQLFLCLAEEYYAEPIELCRRKGWMDTEEIKLTQRGSYFANQAIQVFLSSPSIIKL